MKNMSLTFTILYEWLKYKPYVIDYKEKEESYVVTFEYNDRKGTYTLWSNSIIETTIQENDTIIYYLHYAFHSYHQFVMSYDSFISTLMNQSSLKKIGIACTGGITAYMFSLNMNKIMEYTNGQFHFEPLSYSDIPDVYKDYDMIYIAPQLFHKIRELLKYTHSIKRIDPKIYGTMDVIGFLDKVKSDFND